MISFLKKVKCFFCCFGTFELEKHLRIDWTKTCQKVLYFIYFPILRCTQQGLWMYLHFVPYRHWVLLYSKWPPDAVVSDVVTSALKLFSKYVMEKVESKIMEFQPECSPIFNVNRKSCLQIVPGHTDLTVPGWALPIEAWFCPFWPSGCGLAAWWGREFSHWSLRWNPNDMPSVYWSTAVPALNDPNETLLLQ